MGPIPPILATLRSARSHRKARVAALYGRWCRTYPLDSAGSRMQTLDKAVQHAFILVCGNHLHGAIAAVPHFPAHPSDHRLVYDISPKTYALYGTTDNDLQARHTSNCRPLEAANTRNRAKNSGSE
jgi:hypothetical protein